MAHASISLYDVLPQNLTIRLRGADVLRLESHASPDEEAPLPDIAAAFARAARVGLFGGREVAPWAAAVEVIAAEADLAKPEQTWRLRAGGIDRGAFRVLANVLRSLDLDEVLLMSQVEPRQPPPAILVVDELEYPAAHARLPFELQHEPSAYSSKDRLVQIIFAAPPPEAAVDEAIGALELWSELLMLGGYAMQGTDTEESGCMPDVPFQVDEVTVELAFPELFLADEAAFAAVVNHAAWLHQKGFAVSAVVVR